MNPVTELTLAKNRLQLAGCALQDNGHDKLFEDNCRVVAELMLHIKNVERVVNKVAE